MGFQSINFQTISCTATLLIHVVQLSYFNIWFMYVFMFVFALVALKPFRVQQKIQMDE